ncbi:hypothetical protein SEMRO_2240_G320310.1 [Seminavis robusta]|uniref:Uncharacterized protein n=1 Tax=Seminavis robusta TaxID=568900 RepID=A0A9N8EYW7_9STRA|nr:hypothetical protein SEMRO_2240_G320310.1 [Seminavis robusta]|eukprot:Sro2240_g320310.1 n/a (348) ;mRNA; r:15199-16242
MSTLNTGPIWSSYYLRFPATSGIDDTNLIPGEPITMMDYVYNWLYRDFEIDLKGATTPAEAATLLTPSELHSRLIPPGWDDTDTLKLLTWYMTKRQTPDMYKPCSQVSSLTTGIVPPIGVDDMWQPFSFYESYWNEGVLQNLFLNDFYIFLDYQVGWLYRDFEIDLKGATTPAEAVSLVTEIHPTVDIGTISNSDKLNFFHWYLGRNDKVYAPCEPEPFPRPPTLISRSGEGEADIYIKDTTYQNGIPIVTDRKECNECFHKSMLYEYKDTILIRFWGAPTSVKIRAEFITNREYQIVEGTKFGQFQTFNKGHNRAKHASARHAVRRDPGLASATKLKRKKPYIPGH